MSAPDNANPTILSTAQLPSRRQKRKTTTAAPEGPEFKYNDVLAENDFSSSLKWFGGTDSSQSGTSDDEDQDQDDSFTEEPIDEQEIYDHISTIRDPEHPHTLGQLAVVNLPDIHITPSPSSPDYNPEAVTTVVVDLTPTINHCSMATIIGLAVRVRLEKVLPPNFRFDVRIKDGTHAQDDQVTKQLSDKERVAAALENANLSAMLESMFETCKV